MRLGARDAARPSLWLPPIAGCFKANFDVAMRGTFAVAATVLNHEQGNIIQAVTQKLVSTDTLIG